MRRRDRPRRNSSYVNVRGEQPYSFLDVVKGQRHLPHLALQVFDVPRDLRTLGDQRCDYVG